MIRKKLKGLLLALIALLTIPSISQAYTLNQVNIDTDFASKLTNPVKSDDDYQVEYSKNLDTTRHNVPTFNLNSKENLMIIISEKNNNNDIHLRDVSYYVVDANTGANALARRSAIHKNNKFYIEINPNIFNKNNQYKLKASLHYTTVDKIYTKTHDIVYLEAFSTNDTNIDNDKDNSNTNHVERDNYYIKNLSPEADNGSVYYFNEDNNRIITTTIKQYEEFGPNITSITFYLEDVNKKWISEKYTRIAQMNSVYAKMDMQEDFNINDAITVLGDNATLALKYTIKYAYNDGYTFETTHTLAYLKYKNDDNGDDDDNHVIKDKIYDAKIYSNLGVLAENGLVDLSKARNSLHIGVYDKEPNNEAKIVDAEAFLIANNSVASKVYLDKSEDHGYYDLTLSKEDFSLFSNDTFALYVTVKYAIDDYEYEQRVKLYDVTYNNGDIDPEPNPSPEPEPNPEPSPEPNPANDTILSLNQFALIKGSGPSVYLVNQYNHRFYIPDWSVLKSWYYNPVIIQVNDAQLSQYQLKGNLIYRPGSLIKIATDPKCYAVDANGVLRWVLNEDVARAIYGPSWNKNIYIVPDSLFPSYSIGDPIYSPSDFNMPSLEEAIQMYNK